MRNVRLLLGMNIVLLAAVIILSVLLVSRNWKPQTDPSRDEPNANHPPAEAVALVGEVEIKTQEWMNQLIERHGRDVLDQMIDSEVLEQEAKALGMVVSPEEIEQEIKRMQRGYDSEEQFFQSMREQLGLTRGMLQKDVRDKLLAERIVMKDIRISDELVDSYIADHPEEFAGNVQYRLGQITVGSLTNAQRVLNDLQQGFDFETVARERSLDDATRDSGGNLGWVDANDPFIAHEIMKAADGLEPGEVSKPIAVDNQYVVVKMHQRKEPTEEEIKVLREMVRKELALRDAVPISQMVELLREKYGVEHKFDIDKRMSG